jgi:hypothetical protein
MLGALSGCSPSAAPVQVTQTPACPTPAPVSTSTSPPADNQLATCLTPEDLAGRNSQKMKCGSNNVMVFDWPTNKTDMVTAVHMLTDANEEVHPSLFFSGSIPSLCKQGRFALISDDVHFGVGPSFVMRSDGQMIAKLDLGWGPFFGASDDNKVFWVQTHEGSGVKETRLRVFDLGGKQLLDRAYTKAGEVAEVPFDGQAYRIEVAEPDFPG